jgi:hypothetical protein
MASLRQSEWNVPHATKRTDARDAPLHTMHFPSPSLRRKSWRSRTQRCYPPRSKS